jgi:hypothetical protein
VEDRLLENDFSFEALAGLEQVPWQQCEQHILETESRIVEEFSLKQPATNRNILYTLVGLLATALIAGWYFSSSPETVDLSSTETESASNAPVGKETNIPEQKSSEILTNLDTVNAAVEPPKPEVSKKSVSIKTQPEVPRKAIREIDNREVHIAVGRLIDLKGIAIVDAVVESGNVSDTTDNYGYFALKVPMGGGQITVTHLATEYSVNIDTNQNWEIVLDIAARRVHDYTPMNAANRFK